MLLKISRKIPFLLFISFVFVSCHPGKNEKQTESTAYSTTYDSFLYFKNVRRLFYNQQNIEAANLQIYRLKETVEDEAERQIRFSLVVNVNKDHAYLMTEAGSGLDSVNYILTENPEMKSIDTLEIARGDKDTHYTFANSLYGHILDGHNFWYVNAAGEEVPLLQQKKEREIIRITVYDYFRLVNLR